MPYLLAPLAIASTFLFQLSLLRNTTFWDDKRPGRTITIVLAVTSFALWCAIAVAGRWIAYMTTP